MELTRKQVERCDSIQGIMMSHSLAGGTGSGLGSLFTTKFAEEYPELDQFAFSCLPMTKVT